MVMVQDATVSQSEMLCPEGEGPVRSYGGVGHQAVRVANNDVDVDSASQVNTSNVLFIMNILV